MSIINYIRKFYYWLFKTGRVDMDREEVISQYNKYKEKDPFPDIQAALLNSADIRSYAYATGMLYPFNDIDVKSASYQASLNGICRYWKEDGEKVDVDIQKEGKFTLKPNSIAYVEIEPEIRLPAYIAIRFNLRITHVYRGLLLGTGPLVDPGFEGKIFIPLHNLTSNEYTFSAGEKLIWIEFTKISKLPNAPQLEPGEAEELKDKRSDKVSDFPPRKKNKNLDYYIFKALEKHKSNKIVSSIPMAMVVAKDAALKAQKTAKFVSYTAIAGVLAAAAAIGSLFYQSWSLQRDYIENVKVEVNALREMHNQKIINLKTQLDEYETTTSDLKEEVNKLKVNYQDQGATESDVKHDSKDNNGKQD